MSHRHHPSRVVMGSHLTTLLIASSVGLQSVWAAQSPTSDGFPAMPQVFDRATVQHLLDTVEQDKNDIVLFGGYFARNGTPALPGAEGRTMLDTAIAAAPAGSLRWFKLEYLNGYVRQRYGKSSEALRVYSDLFETSERLQTTGTPSPTLSREMARAVEQYVNMLPLPWWNSTDAPTRNRVLAQAFRVWKRLPDANAPAENVLSPHSLFEIRWKAASDAAGGQDLQEEIARAVAEQPTGPGADPQILMAQASLLEASQPAMAAQYLERALQLVPKDGPPLEQRIRARAEASLTHQYARLGRWDDAIRQQREFVASRGFGQTGLMELLFSANRAAAVGTVVDELSRPEAPENETVLAIQMLAERWRNTPGPEIQKWTLQLLDAYLDPQRKRATDDELIVRREYLRVLRMLPRDDKQAADRAKKADQLVEFDQSRLVAGSVREKNLYDQLVAQKPNVVAWKSEILNPLPVNVLTATEPDEPATLK